MTRCHAIFISNLSFSDLCLWFAYKRAKTDRQTDRQTDEQNIQLKKNIMQKKYVKIKEFVLIKKDFMFFFI